MSGMRPNTPAKFLFVPLVAFAIGGCSSGEKPAAPGSSAGGSTTETAPAPSDGGSDNPSVWLSPTAEPVRGGQTVLGALGDIDSFNNYTAETVFASEIIEQIMIRLMDEQPDFHKGPPSFEPRLAASWEMGADKKSITFHLREGLVWSDGEPLTADDLRFSWEAARSNEVAWANRSIADRIIDVEVVDPSTAIYRYNEEYPYQLMDANDLTIVPKHTFGKVPFKEWREHDWSDIDSLVVSGPFKVESYEPQHEIVLVRNDRYYDPSVPLLDRVVFRVVPDNDALFTNVLAGTFDFMRQVEPKNVDDILETDHLRLAAFKSRQYLVVGWNEIEKGAATELVNETRAAGKKVTAEALRTLREEKPHPLFADPRVRRAMTIAIDRQRIIDSQYHGYADPSTGPVVSSFWAHNKAIKPHPIDTEAARALLEEAGWKDTDGDGVIDRDGVKFEFEILTNAGNKIRENTMELIRDDLAKLGIVVHPRKLEWTVLVETTRNKMFDAYIQGWNVATKVDLKTTFHTLSIETGFNRVGYSNLRVDELIEKARSMPNYLDAAPLWNEIQEILHDEQPWTHICEPFRINAINKKFHNVENNAAYDYINLYDWTIPEEYREQ